MIAVILAGGRGTRLSEETRLIPKPMVPIGGRPILWHIMKRYAMYGVTDFIIALGYKGEVIKDYFFHYRHFGSDMDINLQTGQVLISDESVENWTVRLVDTGEDTMTGGRLGRLRGMLTDTFFLTYGDGLADIDIRALAEFHSSTGAAATVTAVSPPPRFGALTLDGDRVSSFNEKVHATESRINGGFFVLEPEVLELVSGDDCVLEADPLSQLAKAGQLAAFRHDGFWQPMDTLRERDELEQYWNIGNPPWLAS